VSRGVVNRKADAKLDFVVDCYRSAAGKYFSGADRKFLDKRLRFEGMRFLKDLRLYYKAENRFFAISYDLMHETQIDRGERSGPEADCRFDAVLQGKLRISGAAFVRAERSEVSDFTAACVARLNMPLITERIVALDLTNVSASYSAETRAWTIRCRSLIGSTTWNLIPPITQLIRPREDECLRLLEFFELAADALLRT
jgi:hypothetical protein